MLTHGGVILKRGESLFPGEFAASNFAHNHIILATLGDEGD